MGLCMISYTFNFIALILKVSREEEERTMW